MDFSYGTGVFIAAIIWFCQTVFLLVVINSRINKNLKRVGMRLSWVSLKPKTMTKKEMQGGKVWPAFKFLLLCGFGMAGIAAGWISVVLTTWLFLYVRWLSLGMPVAMREYWWKMKNLDMDSDRIISEMMKSQGIDPETNTEMRELLQAEAAALTS